MAAPFAFRARLRQLLPHTLRGRLLLSHLAVTLVGVALVAGFAASTMVKARLAEVEHGLEDRGFLLSNSLEEPVRAFRTGAASGDAILAALPETPIGRYALELLVITPEGDLFTRSRFGSADPRAGPEVQAAFQQGDVTDIRVDSTGREMLYTAVPILHQQVVYGVLRLATPMAPVREEIARAQARLLAVVLGVALLMSGIGWWLAEGLVRPIERLTAAADRLAAEHWAEPVPAGGAHELIRLAQAFNGMAARLQATLDNQRAFVANASHELRTPLTSLKLRAEALRNGAWEDPAVGPRFLAEIESEVDRLACLADDLLDLSRIEAGLDGGERRTVDLAALVEAACAAFAVRARRGSLDLRLEVPAPVAHVLGDESQLYRLLNNLLDNAIKHTPAGGRVTLRLAVADLAGTPAVALDVADTGTGIAPEHLPLVFGRFYRGAVPHPATGGRPSGSGLGLALVHGIVQAHHGQVSLASAPSQGTTVRVILPASPNGREAL